MTFLTFVVLALVILIMIFTLVLLFMTTAMEGDAVGVAEVLIRGADVTPVSRF